jgi:hypothetical protein
VIRALWDLLRVAMLAPLGRMLVGDEEGWESDVERARDQHYAQMVKGG